MKPCTSFISSSLTFYDRLSFSGCYFWGTLLTNVSWMTELRLTSVEINRKELVVEKLIMTENDSS